MIINYYRNIIFFGGCMTDQPL